MRIARIDSVPVVTLSMTIGKKHNDGNFVILTEHETSPGDFWISVPRNVGKKLERDDRIVVVCVLTPSMEFGTETLALKKITSERSSEVLFDRSGHWTKLSGI